MKNLILPFITVVFLSSLFSCGNKPNPAKGSLNKPSTIAFEGNYVSDGYKKKNEGFDWVAVTVRRTGDSTFHLAIRSRIDIKKPTCTFDAAAKQRGSNSLVACTDGKNILFTFSDSTILISAEKPEDNDFLNYFCSGGGSIAGEYRKISEPLDKEQIDPRIFQKLLSLQNIGFDISSTGEGSFQEVTIQTYGLKDKGRIVSKIEGTVTDAAIEDMNSDGFPEVLIFTTSAGSGSYGNVIGYSVNQGKSLGKIAFPTLTVNPKAFEGYMGHDEFAIVETALVRRFRIYRPKDTNNNPTGGYRQISYRLKKGEDSIAFVVDTITEYPANF